MDIPDSLSDLWEYKVSTKADLLMLIDRYWTSLNAFIDSLTPKQLTEVKNPDGWALKDHLTHLTAWQQSVIRFLKGEPRHLGLGIPEAMFLNESYDAMNDAIFREHQHESVETVLGNLRAAHDELLTLVHQLNEDDLQQPYAHYLPDQPGKPDPRRAMDVIYGNTAPHFREHQEWMQQTLEIA